MPDVQAQSHGELSQLNEYFFLTDGGLETTLVFHDQIDLPYFAAFDLLKDAEGTDRLRSYFSGYADIAVKYGCGFIFESATWRANSDWGELMGLNQSDLDKINYDAVALLRSIQFDYGKKLRASLISGCIGPRGDGYTVESSMSAKDAEAYHMPQITALMDAGVDVVSAVTMTTSSEALGVVRGTQGVSMPSVISFTVETDGRLPGGETLEEAIATVDAQSDGGPAYYMINCAHPTHFHGALSTGASWTDRVRGIRANASCMSHDELDNSETLDDGDPEEFAAQYRKMSSTLKNLTVFGGCCGTDERHIQEISKVCVGHKLGANAD